MRALHATVGTIVSLALSACGTDEVTTTTGTSATSASSSSSGGSGPGAGGGGGSLPAGCDPYDEAACDGGEVCIVTDETKGTQGGTECVTPGTKPLFAACGGAGECVAGAHCDAVTATCKPICNNSGDCPDQSDCVAAQTATGAEVQGLKVCLAACEPVATTGCDASEGPVNCTWREDLSAFDCMGVGMKGELESCAEHAECDVGFGCLDVNGQLGCMPWCVYDGGTDICTTAEHPDAQFAICVPQSPAISADGIDYGGCLKQL